MEFEQLWREHFGKLPDLPAEFTIPQLKQVCEIMFHAGQQAQRERDAKIVMDYAKWHKSGWDSVREVYDEMKEAAQAIREQG